jgi:hypothetical protein
MYVERIIVRYSGFLRVMAETVKGGHVVTTQPPFFLVINIYMPNIFQPNFAFNSLMRK